MDKLCFSIDEERYDDRHGHVLSLVGWYMHPEKKKCIFQLLGDGYEVIDIPEIERYERPDVAQSLDVETEGFLPGFTVTIPEVLELRRKYDLLELLLLDGEEKTLLWECAGDDLDELVKDKLVEFHIDRVEVLYGLMLEIQGWTTDQRGNVEVTVHKENTELLDCKITRGRRPDVVERRHLDDDYKNQEIGFSISAAFLEIPGNRIVLHFCGDSTTKTYEIDIKALRKEQKSKGFWGRLFHKDKDGEHKEDYEEWFKRHKADRRTLRKQRHTHFEQNPLISIVIPLYCTPTPYLKELIDSVRAQSYTNWQLCLADGSPDQKVEEYIQKRYGKDSRILYKHLEENGGISINTNKAIEMATGEYLMLSDHDDTLEPDALYEIVKAINDHQGPEIVYTDEDKLSMDGEFYFEPHFKSDYNLFRLRDNNYICHIFAVKKALVDQVGGLRQEYDGSQDYDFILRCCEQAKQVIHIPRVLYHWRCHMNSVAANPESKTYAYEAGCRAIQEHYRRVGIEAEVEMTKHPGWYRSHVKIQGEPLVSILIPNKDHIDDLEKCLSSIYEKSTWKNYEILVVENNSEKPETFEYYKNLSWRYPKARVLTWKEGFNYAAINNFAAKDAKGSYLLFLNNDVEVITPGWIEEMLMICQQPDVAIVGAKLYYPDNLIQHAGVVLGMGGIAGHIMCQASCEDKGYFGRAVNVQEISAVTAACMLMKVEDFEAVGGFDEEFVVAFNDIDLCMKERAAGKKVVFTPYAELYHYESKSRGMEDTPEKQFRFEKETKHFEEKWGEQMSKGDPYYNPNLSSRYYKETNGVYASYAYDMMGIDQANHCVTIVGWDDDFNNFSKDAPESGAWLIANSYGTNYSKDENGYFWVSYYDPSLCEYYTFEGVSADTYQTIFQYDGNGWNNSLRSPEEVKTANVYTADGSQQLQAVAFYTVQEDQPYTVDIYRSVSGKDPTNGTQIKEASVSGNFAKALVDNPDGVVVTERQEGKTTVLEVRVADGEKFSVVITYATVDDSACVPLEGQNDPQNGHCYSASAGQSYTYFAEDAKWYDNTAISVDGVQYDLNNACIKVFGNPADEPVATLTPTATPTVAPVVLPPTKPSTSGTPISTTKPSTSSSAPTSTAKPSTSSTPTSTAAPSDATEQPKRTVSPNAGGRYQTKIKAKAKYTIGKREKITLPVTVTGGSVQAAVKWTSSNTKVAKVTNNGVVKGCKRGTAKIVIQTVDGKKKTIRVTVKKAPKKIKITAQKAKIKKGKTLQTRTILSKGSASYKLRFVSSNKRIATVNSTGKIKAKRRGTVRIYVYTYNNKKSQIKIKIV